MLQIVLSLLSLLLVSSCVQKDKKDLEDLGKEDPYLWLEEVEDKKALAWTQQKSKATLAKMTQGERYKKLEKEALKILQSPQKIPYVKQQGSYLYNFWKDKKNVRGVWRRTTMSEYRKRNPKWEILLDVDQLAQQEKENWVYKGAKCLAPAYISCLVTLSRGGKDAATVREFDMRSKKFVKNGFSLPEAKTWVDWFDKDNIFVATNYGSGTLTESGYPRLVKLWSRGTDLKKAKLLMEVDKKDIATSAYSLTHREGSLAIVRRWKTFFTADYFLYSNGQLKRLPLPDHIEIAGYLRDHFIIGLRKPWKINGKEFATGSLVAVHHSVVNKKEVAAKDVVEIMRNSSKTSIQSAHVLRDAILVSVLENVRGEVYRINFNKGFAKPKKIELVKGAHHTIVSSSPLKNDFFFLTDGFLQPKSFYYYNASLDKTSQLRSLSDHFNSKEMVVQQRWATSQDGTKVPYFLVGKKSQINKGNAPTLLYGYGGFEAPMLPKYSAITGKLWLERGGLYVLANIRGGGEFGPKWHQAALKKNRHKAYDDFIAVAEDIIAKKITNKNKLAIRGRSNGGLLTGAIMTRRPDLFGAVLSIVPLLDMIRYSQLLAGASWMGEYGDPRDPDMREYLLSYSPYHNVDKNRSYPEVFFLTSTKDDRVHPGHARKMAAKMIDQGHKVHYFEKNDGGHKGDVNLQKLAQWQALTYEFLYKSIY